MEIDIAAIFLIFFSILLSIFILKYESSKQPKENKIKFDACPNGYNLVSDNDEFSNIIERKCEPIEGVAPENAPVFYLHSDKANICDLESDWVNNGCFNNRPNRTEQCKAVREYLKGEEGILNSWPQFNINCQED